MPFLTPILLTGAAAFLIPLILHLLNRRRVVNVPWGAMHLLHEVIKQRKRRMQIEQWLLLLTRIAIPIILALALARPLLNAVNDLSGIRKNSLVILLDDSFSMRAPTPSGISAAELARNEIQRILDALPRGSDVQVILIGDTPRPLNNGPTTALSDLTARLTELDSLRGRVSLQNSFQSALAAARQSQHAAREILVISDFQQSDWETAAAGDTVPAVETWLNDQDLTRPRLTFYPIPLDVSENLAIQQVELSAQVLAIDQPVALKVTVQNHGARAWQDIAVHLEADGTRLRTARLSIPSDGEGSLLFTHAFDQLGDHALSIRLEGDSFTPDNLFHSIVQVRNQIPVALIDGDPGRDALGGSLDFLELALAPNLQVNSRTLRDLISTRRIDPKRIQESDLDAVRVAVLGAVPRPSPSLFKTLRQFAENGGGILILPSESADPRQWQQEANQEHALFPATLSGQQHIDQLDFPARLQTTRFTHPALAYFNDPRAGRLSDGEIQHWWILDPKPDARTIATLDRGTPLLVEHSLGDGLVLMSALPLRPGWSNLPLQPWFVPLTQRLIAWLAIQDTEGAWQRLGDTTSLTVPVDASSRPFTLTDPLGHTRSLPLAGTPEAPLIPIDNPSQPGIYTLTPEATTDPSQTRRIAVNLDPTESALTPLSPDRLTEIATRWQAGLVNSFDAYQRLDRSRRLGTEIWQPLILLLVALLFFEVFLQQQIASRR